ncbi:MAG: DNA adenine methylase [Acidobacteria bacterium]|nr:MAG: DNA adenine methylase [Acidobacteriota bacterium]
MQLLTQNVAVEPTRQATLPGCVGRIQGPRPFLKWAGGKSRLVPVLRKCVPRNFGRYFEPFLGGGALFFNLLPARAVLGDSNYDLIHCFKTVRDRPDEVLEYLRSLTVGEEEFYRIRGVDPGTLSDGARAARFIYLNKTCFNGLYRVNKKGLFNTPFGQYKKVVLADSESLLSASQSLRKVELRCEDYSSVLQKARPEDFVYLDPPYLPVGKYSDFKRYTKKQFYESDHEKLAEVFRLLTQKGCRVLLSNSFHERISNLFAGFYQAIVSMPRFINCKGDGRGAVKELLISNYPTTLTQ